MSLAVILAGGAGRRMGGNKPFHPFGGSTLIKTVIGQITPQVEAIAINAGHPAHPLGTALSGLEQPQIFDDHDLSDLGPLSGVLSALSFAALLGETHVFTAPCDMPYLPDDLVSRLKDAPACDVAFMSGKRDHPLCGRWAVSLEPRLRQTLMAARASGGMAVMRFIEAIDHERVIIEDDEAFANVNTPVYLGLNACRIRESACNH